MLCLMHQSERRGYLEIGGVAPSINQLSRMVGAQPSEVRKLLEELRLSDVFSEQSGIIYSRRMVRDVAKEQQDRLNGQRGGNPKILTHAVKQGVNPQVNLSLKPDTNGVVKARARASSVFSLQSSKEEAAATGDIEPHITTAIRRVEEFWLESEPGPTSVWAAARLYNETGAAEEIGQWCDRFVETCRYWDECYRERRQLRKGSFYPRISYFIGANGDFAKPRNGKIKPQHDPMCGKCGGYRKVKIREQTEEMTMAELDACWIPCSACSAT